MVRWQSCRQQGRSSYGLAHSLFLQVSSGDRLQLLVYSKLMVAELYTYGSYQLLVCSKLQGYLLACACSKLRGRAIARVGKLPAPPVFAAAKLQDRSLGKRTSKCASYVGCRTDLLSGFLLPSGTLVVFLLSCQLEYQFAMLPHPLFACTCMWCQRVLQMTYVLQSQD